MEELCHLRKCFFFWLLVCRSGAALLVEAADMGNADAQYELGCRLRVEVKASQLFQFITDKPYMETLQSFLFS